MSFSAIVVITEKNKWDLSSHFPRRENRNYSISQSWAQLNQNKSNKSHFIQWELIIFPKVLLKHHKAKYHIFHYICLKLISCLKKNTALNMILLLNKFHKDMEKCR